MNPEHYRKQLFRITAIAFSVQTALTVFSIALSSTSEFNLPPATLFVCLGIGWALLFLPDLAFLKCTQSPGYIAGGFSVALATIGLLFILAVAGWCQYQIPALKIPATLFSYSLPIIGGIGFIAYLYCMRKQVWCLHTAVLFGMGACFGVFLAFIFWGQGYQSTAFYERIIHGQAHIDTLFHTAIANLWQTYNYPTTGIDGAPLLPYHTGSHLLLGSLAQVGAIHVLDFYNFAYPLIFIPLYLKALVLASLDMTTAKRGNWGAITSFSLIILYYTTTDFVVHRQPFGSESNHIAITLALFLISITIYHHTRGWFLAVLFGTVLFIGYSKISVGAIVTVSLAYLTLRYRERIDLKNKIQLVCYTVLGSLFVWQFMTAKGGTTLHSHAATLGRMVDNMFKHMSSPALLLIAPISIFVLVLFHYRPKSYPDFKKMTAQKNMLVFEILAVSGLFTLLFAAAMSRRANDAFYFLIAYFYLSLPFCLFAFQCYFVDDRPLYTKRIFTLFVVFIMGVSLFARTDVVSRYYELNTMRYDAKKEGADIELGSRRALVAKLLSLDRLPKDAKRQTAIFIPHSNTAFLGLVELNPSTQFLAQALSGIALIGGQLETVFGSKKYPYPFYSLRQYSRQDSISTEQEALAVAGEMGYSQLLVLDYIDGQIVDRKIQITAAIQTGLP